MSKRKKFSPEFKQGAIEQLHQSSDAKKISEERFGVINLFRTVRGNGVEPV